MSQQQQQPQFPEINVSPKLVVAIVAVLAVIGLAWTSFYQVPTDSEAVILRFGKPLPKTQAPGLHFKLPLGMDRVEIVPVLRRLKMEFGFGSAGATNENQYAWTAEEQAKESDMVTGDLASIEVLWVVQYRISDPVQFLFKVRNPEASLRDATESVMRQIVGDRSFTEVLTTGRDEVATEVKSEIQDLIAEWDIGIQLTEIAVTNVRPPTAVEAAFNDVEQARQEKQTTINDADREYKSAIPEAEGAADRIKAEAEGYALQRVNEAEGDANRFSLLFEEYQKAPEVTKRRIYLETMAEVLPEIGQKVIIDSAANQVLPFLPINRTK
ncbi:MAG: membrane protease subunit HflK [Verrucomicrobiales bacterium]|jgi:membrane protease subunit HflK